MARVPYIKREDLSDTHKPIFDRIAKTRGSVQNVFGALMNSPSLGGKPIGPLPDKIASITSSLTPTSLATGSC